MNITKEIARKSLYYLEGNLPDGPTDQAEFEQHKALLKALAATPASSGDTAGAKPEGCALVPVDPTHLMIGAGARAVLAAWEENRNLNSLETVKIAYAAMLGAATSASSVADAAGASGFSRDDLQGKAIQHGFKYWRASDAHGVKGTLKQAEELIADLIGVEVEIDPGWHPDFVNALTKESGK